MKLKYTFYILLLLISISTFSQPGKKDNSSTKQRQTTPSKAQSNTSKTSNSALASNTQSTSARVDEVASYVSPLTGVWRGHFTSGMGFFIEKYRYEVQIGQMPNNGIKGVTYSYKTTVFYGKANLVGMYTPSTRNLILKENKLVEVKISNGDDACLMTCYLEYSKIGNVEVLEGTFTSVNIKGKNDCGTGRVYLEKVPESDFYKEDFVKEYEAKKNQPVKTTEKKDPPTKDVVTNKTTSKPNITKPKQQQQTTVTNDPPVVNTTPKVTDIDINKVNVKPADLPKNVIERENKVAKTIYGEGDEITIELYDNGQIDGDTVTVYHNKELVAYKKMLCHKPITVKVPVTIWLNKFSSISKQEIK
jgi:hypothetical protein